MDAAEKAEIGLLTSDIEQEFQMKKDKNSRKNRHMRRISASSESEVPPKKVS